MFLGLKFVPDLVETVGRAVNAPVRLLYGIVSAERSIVVLGGALSELGRVNTSAGPPR